MSKDTPKQIEELTLLLLWLTSWQEGSSNEALYRAWRGYDFDILDALRKKELITGSYRAKSVYLTEKGVREAKKLGKKYL